MRRGVGALAALALGAALARAGAIPAPPALVAMWEGRDAVSVRAELWKHAAQGDEPGASVGRRMEAGEAEWWLGVQDSRAGRADSALAHWRRAVTLRGDFDEGFALIDALLRRGGAADLDEAHALGVSFAEQARTGLPARSPEAEARLAWARHLRGHADSALAALAPWEDALRRRPAWTRRLAQMELAAGANERAWTSLTLLSARARRLDAEVESLLVRTQHALAYTDERRQATVDVLLEPIVEGERRFVSAFGGGIETLRAKDGFAVRWFQVPAVPGVPRRAPLLFVLAPGDSLAAADTLAAAFAAAGRSVAFLAPRGSYGAVGAGAWGPDAWAGRTPAFEAAVAADAARVMDALARREAPGGAWLVGAGGECAPVALAIARAQKNVQAIVLVAPRLPVVDVAEYRARLRALKTRAFVQISPEEPDALELGDLLARATLPGQVRVADSGQRGRGLAIFRDDHAAAQRLLAWLEEKPARR